MKFNAHHENLSFGVINLISLDIFRQNLKIIKYYEKNIYIYK